VSYRGKVWTLIAGIYAAALALLLVVLR